MMAKQWCKHYRGMHEKDTCEAGVAFKSLPGHGVRGFFDTCPCFGPNQGCASAEYPTDEEMAAHEAEMKLRFENIVIARDAIVAFFGKPWTPGTKTAWGVITCPICNAAESLRFSRSGYNGHIHAACTTDGCVSWME